MNSSPEPTAAVPALLRRLSDSVSLAVHSLVDGDLERMRCAFATQEEICRELAPLLALLRSYPNAFLSVRQEIVQASAELARLNRLQAKLLASARRSAIIRRNLLQAAFGELAFLES